MKKMTLVGIAILVMSMIICSTKSMVFAQAKKQPVTIGSNLCLTGASANAGIDCKRAIQLAVKEINDSGGVLGRPLEVIYEDNQSLPKQGVDAAHKLVEINKVPAVLGGYMSSIALPVGEYLNSVGVVFLTLATTDQVRDIGPYVFNLACSARAQLALIDFAMQDIGAKRFASFTPNNPIGQDQAKLAKEYVELKGGKLINTVLQDVGKTDYRAEIIATMKDNPDAILHNPYAKDAMVIFKQAYEMGYTDTFEKRAKWYSYAIGNDQGSGLKEQIEGIKGQDYGATPIGGRGPHYFAEFTKMFGEKPRDPWAAPFYDAAWVLAIAINMANSLEPKAIRDALYPAAYRYIGVSDEGFKGFNMYGMQAVVAYRNVQILKGELVSYEKPGIPSVTIFRYPAEEGVERFKAPTEEEIQKIYKKK